MSLLPSFLVAACAMQAIETDSAPGVDATPAPDEVVDEAADEGRGPWLWGPDFVPDINLYGNIFARKERKPIFDEDGNEVGDVARVRQVDLIVGAPLAKGVDFLVAGSVQSTLANDDFQLEFEQAFVRFHSLPVLGDIPGDASVLIGQYRPDVGRLNRERLYDLPQPTRPRALTQFFGDNGYSQAGVSGTIAFPVSDAGALRFTAEYMDSGSPPLTDEEGGFAGGNNFRLNWESAADARHGVEFGASQLRTRRADQDGRRARVTIFDALYRWQPEPTEGPLFWLGGEWVAGEIDVTTDATEEPSGYYAWTQLRVHERWALGARFDVSEELDDASLQTRTTGLYATYLMNQYVRVAVAVERSQSDIALFDDVTRVFVELNVAAGTGPDVPFWMR